MSIELRDGLTWFASFEKSFRVPTYTELYYVTPANQGNPDLNPEKAWTGKPGCAGSLKESLRISACFIVIRKMLLIGRDGPEKRPGRQQTLQPSGQREGRWELRFYPQSFFSAKWLSSVGIAYTYLDSDRDTQGMESKYALDYLRHQINGSVVFTWLSSLKQVIKARYGKRMVGDTYTVVDTRLTYTVPNYELFLEATNLFNENYVESGFTPMPDRWIIGGVKFNWE